VFRRGNNAGARGNTAQDEQGAQSLGATETTKTRVRPEAETAKGRPTPKRSEAERGRRQGITGTRGSGGGGARGGGAKSAGTSEDRRAERIRRQEAMRRGEDWALMPRDRGPVKALARDYVDSRRHIGEYLFYVLIVVIVLTFIKVPVIQTYSTLIALVMFVVVAADVSFQVRAIRRLAEQRLPGQGTRGLGFYVGMRTINPRRLRNPAPRVRRGQAI
jgi:hypothetical protein